MATKRQNTQGKRKTLSPTISIFKGVVRDNARDRWRAVIKVDGRLIHPGRFTIEAHAAYAYDLAAVKYFGSHASTNFPVPGSKRWENF